MKRNDEVTVQPIRDGLLTLSNKTYLKVIKQLTQKRKKIYTEYNKKRRKGNAFLFIYAEFKK